MRWALLAAAGAVTSTALAQSTEPAGDGAEERAFGLTLETGFEYDSNITVLELDSISNESDFAALFDVGITYDATPGENVEIGLGYNHSQTLHDSYDEFDVRIDRGSAALEVDLGRVDTGINLQHADAKLAGDGFLVLSQASPHVSRLIGDRWFVRFAYTGTDKDFPRNPARDASGRALSSDAYWFLNGLRTYLSFGYRHDDEDAVDRQFDYSGQRLKTQLTKRVSLGKRDVTVRASVQIETRRYDHPTLSIGVPRRDDRIRFETVAEMPLASRTTLRLGYKRAENRSNLPTVDFDENVLEASILAQW